MAALVARQAISTHAPAGGATICGLIVADPHQFLLTPLREGRPYQLYVNMNVLAISTHAPAGGATRILLHFIIEQQHFYSRPCGRGDEISPFSLR